MTALRRGLCVTGLALVIALWHMSWNPKLPDTMLDTSWEMALHHAFATDMRFGKDIIFTFGPYGFALTRLYVPATFGWMLAIQGMWVFATALSMERLIQVRAAGRWWVAVALAAAILMGTTDFETLPALLVPTFLVSWQLSWEDRTRFADVLLLPAAAIMALSKFTLLVVFLAAVVIMTGGDLFKRRIPWRLPAFSILLPLFWMAAGQRLPDLARFLINSAKVTSGYTDAMALWVRPLWLMVIYVFWAACLLTALGLSEWRARDRAGLLCPLAWAVFLFITFKNGFVRHDMEHDLARLLHMPMWTVIGFLLILPQWSAWRVRVPILAAALLSVGPILSGAGICEQKAPYLEWKKSIQESPLALVRMLRTNGWGRLHNEYDSQLAAIRTAFPLRPAEGTVDVYSTLQSVALAHGMQFHPRPTIQSYSAFTAELAARNAAHLMGPDAPRTMFFAVEPIDVRLASMEDGLSWPILWSRYDLAGQEGNLLRLERSGAPRVPVYLPVGEYTIRLGEWLPIPRKSSEMIWAEARLEVRPLARLWRLAYKIRQPFVVADDVRPQRVIPSVASAGFLLSPLVQSTGDFAAIARGEPEAVHAPRRIRFDLPEGGRWSYQPEIRIKLYRLEFHAEGLR